MQVGEDLAKFDTNPLLTGMVFSGLVVCGMGHRHPATGGFSRMAVSNLIGLGDKAQGFTCTFSTASGGYKGLIQKLLDKQYFKNSHATAATIWADICSTSGALCVDPMPKDLPIVYVAMATDNKRRLYVGKAAKDLRTRYAAGGPNSGGMLDCFNYFANTPAVTQMDVTIYTTTHPSFIEGWCAQVGLDNGYLFFNKLDPN